MFTWNKYTASSFYFLELEIEELAHSKGSFQPLQEQTTQKPDPVHIFPTSHVPVVILSHWNDEAVEKTISELANW